MYACLSTAAWDKDVFRVSSQKFLLFWGSLETHFDEDEILRVKPKAHQLFELARVQVTLATPGLTGMSLTGIP